MMFAFWALAYTWVWSAANQFNRYWQLPGILLTHWRSLVPVLVLLPVVFFFPAPTDPIYWLAVLASAAMVNVHDARLYDVSARYGGQVAFRLRPLILPAVFILWLFLSPQQFTALLASPVIASGIVICLIAATFFLMRLNKCVISKAAFIEMIPVIVTGIMFEITNKTAMDHASFPSNTIYYIYVISGAPLLCGFIAAGKNARGLVRDMAGIAKQGIIIGILSILAMGGKNLAMMYTPNPAYVTAISLTAPFWISLYLKIRGEKENADWIAGTGLVISIIIMTLLAAYLPH